MTEQILTCPDCGQRNRLPTRTLPAGKTVICGRCKNELFGDPDDDLDWDGE